MSESPEHPGLAIPQACPDTKSIAPEVARELPWTGERLVPSARGDFVTEHLHRYALASDLAKEADVLDIACGEGYGSAFLASVAKNVIGVDNDPGTVAHATAKYGSRNLQFLRGMAEKIPLPDHSVDLVVSFETLEHLDDHEAMMREVKRVLRPRGRLLISTPDTKPYHQVSGRTNPFHVRELDLDGFRSLLARHFKHHAIGLQKSISGSWFVPADANAEPTTEYSGGFERVERVPPGAGAPYVVALASDRAVGPIPSSFYNAAQEIAANYDAMVSQHRDSMAALVRIESEFAERTLWARSLETDILKVRTETARLQDEGVELKNWARTLEGELRRTRELVIERTKLAEKQTAWAQSLEKELRETEKHFDQVVGELKERTAWAKSLEDDVAVARGTVAERDREIELLTTWAKSLENDIAETRATVTDRDREIETRTAWAKSLENDIAETRATVTDRDREIETRTAWAKSLEDSLAETRSVVVQRDRLLDERTSWLHTLEGDLAAAQSEVQRLQDVHREAVAWGRSLEDQFASSRTDFARLNEEFADRTRWALSLDAELAATKADRDRVAAESANFARELRIQIDACQRIQAVLPEVPAGAESTTIIDQAYRLIAGLRLELATKDADLRVARAAAHRAELDHAASEAESQRLAGALSDAQIHLDNLLGQTGTLQETLENRELAKRLADQLQRQTERELALRTIEAQHFGTVLSGYERLFVCRLLHRWFGRNASGPSLSP
jgi:SAM-dependent methyltransferase